jgi:Tfp pilus assembly protein PilV
MAEHDRDPDVSRRYRELGAEEPPRALDEAILAASRKVVRKRNWYGPMAIAAVLTLAVAVTFQVERQKPDDVVVASVPPQAQKEAQVAKAPARAEQPAPAQKPARAPQPFTPEPPPAAPASQNADALRDLAKSTEAASAGQGARLDEALARREAEARRPQASAPLGAIASAQIQSKVETPESWLERIAELRKQGKHEEADKALAEFRKRYPDYRLSDGVRAKVERTK